MSDEDNVFEELSGLPVRYTHQSDWETEVRPGDSVPTYRLTPSDPESWRVPNEHPYLAEAIAFLRSQWGQEAVNCPCCTRRVSLDRHRISRLDVELSGRVWASYGFMPFQSRMALFQVTRYDERFLKEPKWAVKLLFDLGILYRVNENDVKEAWANDPEFYESFGENDEEKHEFIHDRQLRLSWYAFTESGANWVASYEPMRTTAWKYDGRLVSIDPELKLAKEINAGFFLDDVLDASWRGAHYPSAGVMPKED